MASTGSNQVLSVSAAVASDSAAEFLNDGNSANRYGLQVQAGLDDQSAAGPSTLVQFNDGDGTAVGSISFGSNLTAYNTTSDQRAKENIVTTSMGLDQLMQIPIRDFNFRADTGQITHTGFMFPLPDPELAAVAVREFLTTPIEWYMRLALATAEHGRVSLSGLGVPVAFVAGSWDILSGTRHMQTAAARIPDATYDELRGTHFIQMEQPDRVHQLLLDFLERVG